MKTIKEFTIPDFFIVGAAKAGTTSLWHFLGQHPDIFMTKEIAKKELSYFSKDYGVKYIEQYESYFMGHMDCQLIGEACHSYLSTPESPALIKQHNPNAKIIIMLRNPIDRAYSLYNWMVQHGYEYLSFNKALDRESKVLKDKSIVQGRFYHTYFRNYLYFHSGLYFDQIKKYCEIFDSNMILILLFDDLKKEPKLTLERIFKFLNLKTDSSDISMNVQNVSSSIRFRKFHFIIKNYLPWIMDKLRISSILKSMIVDFLSKITIDKTKPKPLTQLEKKRLLEAYKENIIKISKLINRDLSNWLH